MRVGGLKRFFFDIFAFFLLVVLALVQALNKELCVSGYPTALKFLTRPYFFKVVLGDFQGIFPVAILFPYHPM